MSDEEEPGASALQAVEHALEVGDWREMRAELDRLEAVQLDDASRARVVALRTLAAPDRIAVAIAVLTAIGYLVIAALLYL